MFLTPTRLAMFSGHGSQEKAPAGGSTTTFDAADLSGVTLSNGNLTVTYSSTANAQVRSVASHSTGKYHCEFTIVALTSQGFPNFGIASASHVFSNYCGQELTSCGAAETGFSYLNASSVANDRNGIGAHMTWSTGDVIAMEVDLDGGTIQWQNFTQFPGVWSNTPRNISTMTNAPFFICVNLKTAADSYTLNAGGSAYSVTPTSGYGNW